MPNKETARFYVCSGDPHVALYLDNVLCKTWRIRTRSSRDHEDSTKSGEVEIHPYKEGARWERALVRDILRRHRWEVIVADQIPMIGACSEGIRLSTIC